jgi:transcriptional regulator with XRE-family HTH domain
MGPESNTAVYFLKERTSGAAQVAGNTKVYRDGKQRSRYVRGVGNQEKTKPPALTLGERIRSERKARGWSQTELAKRAGLGGKQHIYAIEKSLRGDPRGSTLRKIAAAFGMSVERLAGESAPIPEFSAEAALEAFRKSEFWPGDVTPEEIEKLRKARLFVERPTARTMFKLLELIRSEEGR